MKKTTKVRKSGLTFAAEAGTQRLRDVINKNVTWDEIEKTCSLAFANGYTSVKLYFMMGLPTETMEDIEGIAETAQKVVDLFYSNPKHAKGRGVQVTISCACFVPKPHTPFQFVPMDTEEMLQAKQKHLLESVPQPQDQGQLPRQHHQLPRGRLCQGRPPLGSRHPRGLQARLLF